MISFKGRGRFKWVSHRVNAWILIQYVKTDYMPFKNNEI